jgi:hypothetical protein
MTKEELSALITTEINGYKNVAPSHIEALKRNLVEPEKKIFFDEDEKPLELWIVAEEDSANKNSFMVVFDDTSNEFGLAMHTIFKTLQFLGYRGNLLGAYRSIFEE